MPALWCNINPNLNLIATISPQTKVAFLIHFLQAVNITVDRFYLLLSKLIAASISLEENMNTVRLWLLMYVLVSMVDSILALPFDVALPRSPSKNSVRDTVKDFIENNSLIQEYILNRNAVQNIIRDNNLKIPSLARKYCKRFCIFGLELLVYTAWSTDRQHLIPQQQEGTGSEVERDLGADGGLKFNFEIDGASLLRTPTPYRIECRVALRRSLAGAKKSRKTKKGERKKGLFAR